MSTPFFLPPSLELLLENQEALPGASPWLWLFRFAWVCATGRLLLSLLPAGLPGEHRPQGLPLTWASSHALGVIALGAQARWLGVPLWSLQSSWLYWSPWALLLAFRLASLPAAMVPRHRPLLEPVRPAQGAMFLAGLLALWVLAPGPPPQAAGWLASALLLAHGLRGARLAPFVYCMLPGLLAVYLKLSPLAQAPLALALGVGFCIPWLLVADRRACALACVGFGSLVGSAPILAGAGLLMLLALSRQPSRKYALTWCLASSLVFWLLLP